MRTQGRTVHVIADLTECGGTERVLALVVEALDPSHTTIVSFGRISRQARELIPFEGVEFVDLNARSIVRLPVATYRLARLLRDSQPATVFAWMYIANGLTSLAALVARYRGPVIWNVRHAWATGANESTRTTIAMRLGALLSRHPHAIVFNSARALRQHLALGYSGKRARVIVNGVSLPIESATNSHAPPPRRIGVAARLHRHKDYPTMVAALRQVARIKPEVQIAIAGRGISDGDPLFAELRAEVGNALQLLGEVRDMASFYRSIDVLALSSVTESFPNVLIEAMSYGVPCVTTDVGDAALIVGGSGQVVPVGDSGAMSRALLTLLSLPGEAYQRRREQARSRVGRLFTVERMAEEFRAVLGPG